MSRWQEIIANLLGDLANVSPGGDVRRDVDGLISEAETLAAHAEPTDVLETPKREMTCRPRKRAHNVDARRPCACYGRTFAQGSVG
jgi:hypothetical protein